MRVAFLIQDTGWVYGAERASMDLAGGLQKRGCEVCFLLIEEKRRDLAAAFRKELQRRHLRYSLLPCGGRFSWSVVTQLRAAAAAEQADVIHAVGYKADVHLVVALSKASRPVCVSTVHGWLERPDWKERFYGFLDRRALRRFNAVIALSRFYEQRLLMAGLHREKLVLIPSGLDKSIVPGVDRAQHRYGRNPEFTIGMLGRLSWEKNQEMLLDALAMLKQRGMQFSTILAGDGPEKTVLERRAMELGVNERIRWVGYIPADSFFEQIDVLVLCSRIENLPYSILEAMAWCRPVIATNVGGIPDLVVDGETGWLVPAGDAHALAERIQETARHPMVAREMGLRARQRLEKLFTLETCVEQHLRLYAKLIEGCVGYTDMDE